MNELAVEYALRRMAGGPYRVTISQRFLAPLCAANKRAYHAIIKERCLRAGINPDLPVLITRDETNRIVTIEQKG